MQLEDFNKAIVDLTAEANQRGVKYGFGSKSTESGAVDCSGWVCEALSKAGIPVAGTAADIAKQAHEAGRLSNEKVLQPGDLVFTGGQSHAKDRFQGIGHAGIVVERDGQLYVSESSSSKGVTLTPVQNFVKRNPSNVWHTPANTFVKGRTPEQPPLAGASNIVTQAGQGLLGGIRQDVGSVMGSVASNAGRLTQALNQLTGTNYAAANEAGIPVEEIPRQATEGQRLADALQRELVPNYDYENTTATKAGRMLGSLATMLPTLAMTAGVTSPMIASMGVRPAIGHMLGNVVPFALHDAITRPDPLSGGLHGAGMGAAFGLAPGGRVAHPLALGAGGYLQSRYMNPNAAPEDHYLNAAFMGLLGGANALWTGGARNPVWSKEGRARPVPTELPAATRLQEALQPTLPEILPERGLREYAPGYGLVQEMSPYVTSERTMSHLPTQRAMPVTDYNAPAIEAQMRSEQLRSVMRQTAEPGSLQYGQRFGNADLWSERTPLRQAGLVSPAEAELARDPLTRSRTLNDYLTQVREADALSLQESLLPQQQQAVADRFWKPDVMRPVPERGYLDAAYPVYPGEVGGLQRPGMAPGTYPYTRFGEAEVGTAGPRYGRDFGMVEAGAAPQQAPVRIAPDATSGLYARPEAPAAAPTLTAKERIKLRIAEKKQAKGQALTEAEAAVVEKAETTAATPEPVVTTVEPQAERPLVQGRNAVPERTVEAVMPPEVFTERLKNKLMPGEYNAYGVPVGTEPLPPRAAPAAPLAPEVAPEKPTFVGSRAKETAAEKPAKPDKQAQKIADIKAKIDYAYGEVEKLPEAKQEKLLEKLDEVGYYIEQGDVGKTASTFLKTHRALKNAGIAIPKDIKGEVVTAAEPGILTEAMKGARLEMLREIGSSPRDIRAQATTQATGPALLPEAPINTVAERAVVSKIKDSAGNVTGERTTTSRYNIVTDPDNPSRFILQREIYDTNGNLTNRVDMFDGTAKELTGKILRSNDLGLKENLDRARVTSILGEHPELMHGGLPLPPVVNETVGRWVEQAALWGKEMYARSRGKEGPLTQYRDLDMSRGLKWLRLPHFVAKKHPEIAEYTKTVTGQIEKQQSVWTQAVRDAKTFMFDIKDPVVLRQVEQALIQGDQLGFSLKNAPKHEVTAKLTQWRQHLQQTLDPQAYEAYMGVRKALDTIYTEFRKTLEDVGMPQDKINRIMQEAGFQYEYFPHRWADGNYFMISTDPASGVKTRHVAKTLVDAIKMRKELVQQYGEENVTKHQKNENIPEEAFFNINPEHSARIAEAALKRVQGGKMTPEQKEEIRKSIEDSIKTRGFGMHYLDRSNVQGFETTNLRDVFNSYTHGAAGYFAKLQAAPEYYKMLNSIDARSKPVLYDYAHRLVKDVMTNSTKLDSAMSAVRAFGFHMYLGANLKSAAVNLTQNMVTFAPYMSEFTKAPGRKTVQAMKDILGDKDAFFKLQRGEEVNWRNLTTEESQAMNDLFRNGALTDFFTKEMVGSLQGKGYGILDNLLDKSRAFFSNAEVYNRMSAGLMAYRVFRGEKGMPHADAIAKAREVIFDTHFMVGKFNLPEFARGSDMGKIVRSTGYMFRSFMHNYGELLAHMYQTNPKGFASSVGMMAGLGGITAVPLLGMAIDVYKHFTGEDPVQIADKDDPLYTMMRFGLPGFLGADISGSMKMDPVQMDTPGEMAMSALFGPFVGLGQNAMKAYEQIEKRDWWKAGEHLAPAAIKNLSRGVREYTQGVTSKSGQDIIDPMTGEQERLDEWHAIGQALGFRPVPTANRVDEEMQVQRRIQHRNSVQDTLATRMAHAIRRNDMDEMDAVMEQVIAYNNTASERNEPTLDMGTALDNRLKPTTTPSKWRRYRQQLATGG